MGTRLARALLVASLLAALAGVAHAAGFRGDPYATLGVGRKATDVELKRAHKRLALMYHPDKNPNDVTAAQKFLEVQGAYEVLSDPEKRRNYDLTGFADPQEAAEAQARAQRQGGGGGFRRGPGQHPFRGTWDTSRGGGRGGFWPPPPDAIPSDTTQLTEANFKGLVLEQRNAAWFVQVYHDASEPCHRLSPVWEQAARQLEGLVKLGRVHWEHDVSLAAALAPASWFLNSGPVAFQQLPVVMGFPKGCASMGCARTFRGDIRTPEPLVAFATDRLLRLNAVRSYTRHNFQADFLDRAPPHKVRLVALSPRDTPASPLLRLLATENSLDVAFARVTYRKEDAAYWRATLGVNKAPAVVFIKEPGSPPVVFEGVLGRGELARLLEEHRYHTVKELTATSAMTFGCMPRNNTMCVVAVGKAGPALDELRARVRAAVLQNSPNTKDGAPEPALEAALAERRVVFMWADTAVQTGFCDAHEACKAAGGAPGLLILGFSRQLSPRYGYVWVPASEASDARTIAALTARTLRDGVFPSRGKEGIFELGDPLRIPSLRDLVYILYIEGPMMLYSAFDALHHLVSQVYTLIMGSLVARPELVPMVLMVGLPVVFGLFGADAKSKMPEEDEKARKKAAAAAEKRTTDGGRPKGSASSKRRFVELSSKTLEDLEGRKVYVVMLVVAPCETPAEERTVAEVRAHARLEGEALAAFKRFTEAYREDPRVVFATVDATEQKEWVTLAQSEARKAGGLLALLAWHPDRGRYQRLGALGGPGDDKEVAALHTRVDALLDGGGAWTVPHPPKWPALS